MHAIICFKTQQEVYGKTSLFIAYSKYICIYTKGPATSESLAACCMEGKFCQFHSHSTVCYFLSDYSHSRTLMRLFKKTFWVRYCHFHGMYGHYQPPVSVDTTEIDGPMVRPILMLQTTIHFLNSSLCLVYEVS